MVEQASQTARSVMMLRAAHQLLDAPPAILEDPVALLLAGEEGRRRIRDSLDRLETGPARALRSHVVLRSRFAEDRLAEAVGRGVRQCVILGAGFDTFAFRQPKWARETRIIEIDQPATQAQKEAELTAAGIQVPANVSFVAIDFERESLRSGMRRAGIAFDQSTFFSWLGVTVYLARPTVDDVLRTISNFPGGSEVVLTFARPPGASERSESGPSLAQLSATVGEPWLTFFEPAEIVQLLEECGFSSVSLLSPEDATTRYFRDRTDTLPPPRRASIVSAVR